MFFTLPIVFGHNFLVSGCSRHNLFNQYTHGAYSNDGANSNGGANSNDSADSNAGAGTTGTTGTGTSVKYQTQVPIPVKKMESPQPQFEVQKCTKQAESSKITMTVDNPCGFAKVKLMDILEVICEGLLRPPICKSDNQWISKK